MASKLKNLRMDRIDLVDKGANPGARITLCKRKEPTVADEKTKEAPATAELPDDVQKRLDAFDAVKKQADELAKRLDESEKREKESQARVTKMEDDRLREVAIRKAAGMKHLGAADDLGGLLYDVRKLDATLADKFEAKFAGWNTQIEKGSLFSEIGSGHADESSPEGKLEALTQQIITKASEPLTHAQAYVKALETTEGKRLYAAMRQNGGK